LRSSSSFFLRSPEKLASRAGGIGELSAPVEREWRKAGLGTLLGVAIAVRAAGESAPASK